MHKSSHSILMGMLGIGMAFLLGQGCASLSGSGGDEEKLALQEVIEDPVIKHIQPQDLGLVISRKHPAMRAELTARNVTGMPNGSITNVLFDFDRASIRTDALPILESNAKRLKADGISHLLLEGRGDEFGTAAYNIVLGDRRARNVKSYLQQLEFFADINTTSYGKDHPLCLQHSSECFQQNRSVHFVIKK
jgi:peptidoglycan-associated lipoprotein